MSDMRLNLDCELTVLDLPARARNILYWQHIKTVRQLVHRTERALITLRGFGEATLIQVKHKLSLHGLTLGMNSSVERKPRTDGGPAFPFTGPTDEAEALGIPNDVCFRGMSLRDWFAGKALASMNVAQGGSTTLYARDAYNLADAMLAERAKEKPVIEHQQRERGHEDEPN